GRRAGCASFSAGTWMCRRKMPDVAADPERASAEGALRGVLDQPSAVVKRFFWLLFFAQAKKSDPRQRKLLLLLPSVMLQNPGRM
ncbi:hypothetical protein, partial [Pantoea dispersa]|uniref:hypothetical protein n=1 Tax=Pantoea dispersa TaxID=59814 RepID=UPI001C65B674